MKFRSATLVTIFLVLFSVAAAEAQEPEDEPVPTTVEEPASPDDEAFPPLPEIDGEQVEESPTPTTVDENSTTTTSPTTPSPGPGLSPADPFWFLPPDEGEFSYAESRDRWEEICNPDPEASPQPTDTDDPSGATRPSLPDSFIDLYGDPDWSCGDARRGSQDSASATAFGTDEIGRVCQASICSGQVIPTSNYDVGADEGAWNHAGRKSLALFTSLPFTGTKSLMMATHNLLEWAFGFEVAAAFADTVSTISVNYYAATRPAYDLALFLTMFVVGVHLLRGRTSAGLTELAMTSAIYSLFLFMAFYSDAGYARFLNDSIEWTGQTSGAMAEMAMADLNANSADCPPIGEVTPTGETVGLEGTVCPFGKGLHAALIETPYDLINWGAPLEGECAIARDEILWQGPWGNSDEPRFIMGEASGCEQHADYNHDPTAERFGLAAVMLVAALCALLIIALTALTIIAAQLMMAGLICVLPFAVVVGLIPGPGREALIKWAVFFGKAMLSVVALAMFLSFYLVSLNVIVQITADRAWIIQIGGILVLTGLMLWLRQRVVKSSNRAMSRFGAKVSSKFSSSSNSGGSFSDAASNGFAGQRLRLQRRAGLYEARYAGRLVSNGIRRVRNSPGNFKEMRTNQRERKAIRKHGHRPAVAPPKGFSAAARTRSRTKTRRNIRSQKIKNLAAKSSSANKLRRGAESVARHRRVERELKAANARPDNKRVAKKRTQRAVAKQNRNRKSHQKVVGRAAKRTTQAKYGRRTARAVTPPFKKPRPKAGSRR